MHMTLTSTFFRKRAGRCGIRLISSHRVNLSLEGLLEIEIKSEFSASS